MIDETDRAIIQATQAGLPLTPDPWEAVANQADTTPGEVRRRMQRMLDEGIIRRIGAVPNHYRLGFRGNGMSVWDLPDRKVRHYGQLIGELEFVSHAYHRPRHLPLWPYNLFAMVHGHDREEVLEKVERIAELLGEDNRGHEVLFSTRILKKAGFRLSPFPPGEKKQDASGSRR